MAVFSGIGGVTTSGKGRSWATTEKDGSFEIPPTPLGASRLRWHLEHRWTTLTWVHRAYGWDLLGVSKAELDHVEIRAERDPEKLDKMRNPRKSSGWGPCGFLREAEPGNHCCEVTFGWTTGCMMRGQ